MTIEQFIQDYGFSSRDSFAAIKMYSGQEKTESEWIKELKDKFSFSFIEDKPSKQNKEKE